MLIDLLYIKSYKLLLLGLFYHSIPYYNCLLYTSDAADE